MERRKSVEPKDRIIVALDVNRSDLDKLEKPIKQLWEHVGYFKIGPGLIYSLGTPNIFKWFENCFGTRGTRKKVFLDVKLNDTPETMKEAAKAITAHNVGMFSIHASSGIKGMMAAREGFIEVRKLMYDEITGLDNAPNPFILAVTVLTSFDENDAHLIYGSPIKAKVIQLARDATLAGMDGIVCSPPELEILGTEKKLESLIKVVTIKPGWAVIGNQNKTATPAGVIATGADYLIIERAILNPPPNVGSPLDAVKRIQEEIASVGDKISNRL